MSSWRNSLAELTEQLRAGAATLPRHSGYCVAFSGGRDSTALLHAACRAGLTPLRAVHVHHGLHAQADAWEQHVRDAGQRFGTPVAVLRVSVHPAGNGPEAAAREARYAALRQALKEGEVLCVAHHADDQAETVLFRLARGAGLQGLGAMRPCVPFGRGFLWRPLLTTPRVTIEAWNAAHGLGWVDDPDNTRGANLRATLRPLLASLDVAVPGASAAMARFADHAAEQQALINAFLAPELESRLVDGALQLAGLEDMQPPRRHALLRLWLARLGVTPPGRQWLERFDSEVLAAREDSQPELRLGRHRLHRFAGSAWLLPAGLTLPPEGWSRCWRDGAFVLPGDAGRLEASGPLPPDCVVRFVHPGERVQLERGRAERKVKRYFQEWRIPPWERRRTPLVLAGPNPVYLGDRRLAAADRHLGSVRIRWDKPRWHCAAAGRENHPGDARNAE